MKILSSEAYHKLLESQSYTETITARNKALEAIVQSQQEAILQMVSACHENMVSSRDKRRVDDQLQKDSVQFFGNQVKFSMESLASQVSEVSNLVRSMHDKLEDIPEVAELTSKLATLESDYDELASKCTALMHGNTDVEV